MCHCSLTKTLFFVRPPMQSSRSCLLCRLLYVPYITISPRRLAPSTTHHARLQDPLFPSCVHRVTDLTDLRKRPHDSNSRPTNERTNQHEARSQSVNEAKTKSKTVAGRPDEAQRICLFIYFTQFVVVEPRMQVSIYKKQKKENFVCRSTRVGSARVVNG